MADLELQLVNGGMRLNIVAMIGDNALLKRLNDNSFVVVNGLHIHNDFTCDWNFAYGYVSSYDDAYRLFNDKVVNEWLQYGEEFEEDICSDEDFEGMTLEDLTGIPTPRR